MCVWVWQYVPSNERRKARWTPLSRNGIAIMQREPPQHCCSTLTGAGKEIVPKEAKKEIRLGGGDSWQPKLLRQQQQKQALGLVQGQDPGQGPRTYCAGHLAHYQETQEKKEQVKSLGLFHSVPMNYLTSYVWMCEWKLNHLGHSIVDHARSKIDLILWILYSIASKCNARWSIDW